MISHPDPEWARILHETATIITALAAAIAAGSSLKNGRTLRKNGHHGIAPRSPKARKKETTKGDAKELKRDWYTPPML